MPRSQSGRSLETLSAARRYATRRSLHERFSGKKTKLWILLPLFAHRAGERVSTKHHVETGNRGVSRSHHRRLTDLPLKTMESSMKAWPSPPSNENSRFGYFRGNVYFSYTLSS